MLRAKDNMKTIITIDSAEKLVPGTLNHLAAIIANPNNTQAITVEEKE